MSLPQFVRVSTPGRVCLFGEHQDYLGLPVIACAISLRITVEGERHPDPIVRIDLPDIGKREEFDISAPLVYVSERDYLRSAVNVLRRHGFSFTSGFSCRVHGKIPINSGTSSSSALLVSWMNFLARMSDPPRELDPERLGRLAYEAEVLEFGEPGGMMDHFATAFGGALYIDFVPAVVAEPLHPPLGTFVLGDSGEPKDTRGILARTKFRVLDIVARLGRRDPPFDLGGMDMTRAQRYREHLTDDEWILLEGTLKNHVITRRARALMKDDPFDHDRFGALLSEHQDILRDVLRISTPKIDRMLAAALDAGAFGGKINGSGGGGCMFAYAPENPEAVAQAVEAEGGKAYIVERSEGTTIESEY